MSKSVLLLGADGMLGQVMRMILPTVCNPMCSTRADHDLRYKPAIDAVSAAGRHEFIVNCAGVIPQRDGSLEDMVKVNSLLPITLGHSFLANISRGKVIHISTDCVFSGRDGPYSESDAPDPVDDYGRTKLLGELPNAMVIRTSFVGHSRDRSYGLLDWALSQEGEIEGWSRALWNGVTCLQLARYVRGIIAQGSWRAGIVHYHSSEIVSKFQLLRLILAVYGKDQEAVKGIPGPDINRALVGTEAPASIRNQIEDQRRFWEAG